MISIHLEKTLSSAAGVLHLNVDLSVQKGELVALYGASGTGKTSILRMIAGLLKPENGRVEVLDRVWYDQEKKIFLKTQQRNFGIVFQDYALFPNMTVRENIAFGLSSGNPHEVDEMIELMELTNLQNKKPLILSGGQRQRVAFARAIIRKPDLLLLDEPFVSLDTALRTRMQDFTLRLHKQLSLTTILVSHDLVEVARLSDRVFLLENGSIVKSGPPKDVIPYQQFESILQTIAEKYRP
jgi:molybdate transport system ATP-binding protein